MKRIILGLAAVSAIGIAAPAAAQYNQGYQSNQGYQNNRGYQNYDNRMNDSRYGYNNPNPGMDNRISNLDARFQAGLQSGAIDRTEARQIRPQLRELMRLEQQYSLNGLTQQERMDLQNRIRSVRQQLQVADNGTWNRDDRYADANDGYYGQGGPYEDTSAPVCERRAGIGGVIDNVLGRDECATLRVGQRATSSLSALPWQYRNTYRDDRNVYYRTDNQAIYQIDARTGTVLRVYGMNR